MSDETPPPELPAIGSVVHIAFCNSFGRVVGHHVDPAAGPVVHVDLMGRGIVLALPMALWTCPAIAGRPSCNLPDGMGRA